MKSLVESGLLHIQEARVVIWFPPTSPNVKPSGDIHDQPSNFIEFWGAPKFRDTHIKERPTKNNPQSLNLWYVSECNTTSWQCFTLVSGQFDHFDLDQPSSPHIFTSNGGLAASFIWDPGWGRGPGDLIFLCRLAPLQEAPCVTAKFVGNHWAAAAHVGSERRILSALWGVGGTLELSWAMGRNLSIVYIITWMCHGIS